MYNPDRNHFRSLKTWSKKSWAVVKWTLRLACQFHALQKMSSSSLALKKLGRSLWHSVVIVNCDCTLGKILYRSLEDYLVPRVPSFSRGIDRDLSGVWWVLRVFVVLWHSPWVCSFITWPANKIGILKFMNGKRKCHQTKQAKKVYR